MKEKGISTQCEALAFIAYKKRPNQNKKMHNMTKEDIEVVVLDTAAEEEMLARHREEAMARSFVIIVASQVMYLEIVLTHALRAIIVNHLSMSLKIAQY